MAPMTIEDAHKNPMIPSSTKTPTVNGSLPKPIINAFCNVLPIEFSKRVCNGNTNIKVINQRKQRIPLIPSMTPEN